MEIPKNLNIKVIVDLHQILVTPSPIISKLAVGFAYLGVIFSSIFFTPKAINSQVEIVQEIFHNSSQTIIAQAPIAMVL
ncbi:MAG: hypothetical protein DCF20_03505 [Pseudanabaena sp.]|nr:MAG: hypothetical protein DCF20_03505 [Pseudanabaena sp.]